MILCGGRSSRMGRDKAWLPFHGETLLQRASRRLARTAWPVAIVAHPGQKLPPLPSDLIIAHDREEGRGPMQGLAAGLCALEPHVQTVFVCSCDMPFLQTALMQLLWRLLGDHCLCIPETEGTLHPLAAVYRAEVRATAERMLDAGVRSLRRLVNEVRTRVVGASELRDVDPHLRSLLSINTPEAYLTALCDVR
jgi:molybdopterin-guanine dinucleotide biosynthesis protein A